MNSQILTKMTPHYYRLVNQTNKERKMILGTKGNNSNVVDISDITIFDMDKDHQIDYFYL